MLVVFAATGLLRGLQDTRTPLWVAGIGFAVNIALNYVFIYVAGWGIAGSAVGTVIAQWGMVVVYLVVVARHAARVGASSVAAPRRRAARRGVGRLAVPAHGEPAARAAARDVGGDLARFRRARGVPGRDDDLLHDRASRSTRSRSRRRRSSGAGSAPATSPACAPCSGDACSGASAAAPWSGALVIATAWVLPALFTSSRSGRGAAAADARGARALGAARRPRVRARRRAHRRRRRALPRLDRHS